MATLKATRKRRQVIAIVAIAIIIAGVGGAGIVSMGARKTPTPAFTKSQPILDELVTVEAKSFRYFEFNIADEINNAAVKGAFFSVGSGQENDIVVSVVPEIALQNINEGAGYPAFYFSGKVASGDVDASISETGTMYVIVDNRFSESPKSVEVNIELFY